QTGYSGRLGVFEVLVVTERIEILIASSAPAEEIEKVGREEGMRSLLTDGISKARAGETSISEVMRVVE
ncbi:MAG: type II/IV secretion system protein, partial [Terriglobia bacterium]